MLLADPATVYENSRTVLALERRDDHVTVLPVAQTRADEHLLVVAQTASGVDAAVVEVMDGGRVDLRRQREGFTDEAVFELSNELGFPAEALDLPCAEREGCYRHDG